MCFLTALAKPFLCLGLGTWYRLGKDSLGLLVTLSDLLQAYSIHSFSIRCSC